MLLALVACGGSGPRVVEIAFAGDGNRHVVRAEVADTPERRARGLMDRSSLDRGAGMAFLYEGRAPRAFHMKDTLIPLDLVSVADGRVVAIQRMDPCRRDPCLVTTTPPADLVIELAAGTLAAAGIGVGAVVAPPDIP